MGTTFDLSGLRQRLTAAREAVPAGAPAHLTDAATQIVSDSAYAVAIPPEYNDLEPAAVLTEVRETEGGADVAIAVLTLYDWVLEDGRHHCFSPDGLDCVTFARLGPYTEETKPANPGDGTTPCGGLCYCQLVPRDTPAGMTAGAVAAALAPAVLRDVADAWGSA